MDQSTFLLRDVRIFDGAQVWPVGSVLVRAGIIAEVGRKIVPPDGCAVIEGGDRTLLPGLIDAHVHLPSYPPFAPRALRQGMAFGVTTQLDMSTDPSNFPAMRADVARGDDVADFRSAGWAATAPGGHPARFWDSFPTLTRAGEAEAWVADRIAEGSDYIKIIIEDGSILGESYPRLAPDIVPALITAARRRGKLAIVHATVRATALEALAAGVDGLAHLYVGPPPDAADAAAIRAAGAFVIPTAGVVERASGAALARDDRRGPYVQPVWRELLEQAVPAGPGSVAAPREALLQAVGLLHRAGVPLVAGTDAPAPGTGYGISLHDELARLVDAGLSPVEAIAAATSAPARHFSLQDRGRIAPGLQGDLLLVRGDPTADITATREIVAVWRRGRRFDREEYRATLPAAGS